MGSRKKLSRAELWQHYLDFLMKSELRVGHFNLKLSGFLMLTSSKTKCSKSINHTSSMSGTKTNKSFEVPVIYRVHPNDFAEVLKLGSELLTVMSDSEMHQPDSGHIAEWWSVRHRFAIILL